MPADASVSITAVANIYGSHVPAADGSFDSVSVAESNLLAVATGPSERSQGSAFAVPCRDCRGASLLHRAAQCAEH